MKRALLIGSQTFGLQGVHNDLKLMEKALEQHGFSTHVCKGPDASRAGILHVWRELNAAATADDGIVIYYAGHGARASHPGWRPGASVPRYLPFLVPTDFAKSNEHDFRGILDLEIAELLAELTRNCPNVALLLDCCHSARLVRSARGRARAFGKDWKTGVAHHIAHLEKAFPKGLFHREGNPFAVRLAAAGPHQSAFEDPDENLGGYFTEVLAEALLQAKDTPVNWAQLGAWVREQVLIMEPRQRPEVEGPANRLLFQHETQSEPKAVRGESLNSEQGLTFFYDGPNADQPSIRGGHLHTIVAGNCYAVYDLHSPTQRTATVEVTQVCGAVSRVSVSGDSPMDGSPVKALRELYPTMGVRLDDEIPATLHEALAQSSLLHVARAGQEKALASIISDAGGWTVVDEAGLPMHAPTQHRRQMVSCLENMARAHVLRELQEEGDILNPNAFQLDWGQVLEAGKTKDLDPIGAELHVGDRIYVRLTNRGSMDLYVNLFDIGISRKITLLNYGSHSGHHLHPEEAWCFGYRALKGLEGIPLSWSANMPKTGPRLESLVAIISNQPMNLTSLCGNNVGPHRSTQASGLESMIAARCMGGHRSHANAAQKDIAYAIRHIHFELFPNPRTRSIELTGNTLHKMKENMVWTANASGRTGF